MQSTEHVATPISSIVEAVAYPTILGISMLVLVGGVATGISYWILAPVVLCASALVVVLLERTMPWSRGWQRDHGDARTDTAHLVANLFVGHVSIAMYAALLGDGARGIWPPELPFFVQFLVAAIVMDLGLYVVHRASHRVGWLWRLHAIHHSAPRLYWLNGQRRHVVHEVLEGTPGILVLGVVGAPASAISCYVGVLAVHLMMQHGNFRQRVGALRMIFAVAELHRWHHQRRYAATQGNYGALLSVWDRLFGTVLPSTGEATPDVGMDDEPDLPAAWWPQLAWPFRAARLGASSTLRAVSIFALMLVLSACATTLAPVAGELVASVGPVDLPAASAGHSHADMTEKLGRWRVAEAGWITSFTPGMADGDGNALAPELLHHVAIADRGRRDPLCTEHPHRMPQLLLAAGAEMTRVELPEGYGIPVGKGAKLVGMGMCDSSG